MGRAGASGSKKRMSWGSSARARVAKATRMALNELGRRGVADIRQDIGIRTQRVGSLIIRSDPGESPRRQTPDIRAAGRMELWKSIKYRVRARARGLQHLIIYTRDPKAPWLEQGTFHMEPRPFWEKARRRIGNMKKEFAELYFQFLGPEVPPEDFPSDDAPPPDGGDEA